MQVSNSPLLPGSGLFGTEDIVKEAGPEFLDDTGFTASAAILATLDLLTHTRATDCLSQGEWVNVDGVVVNNLGHGAGGDVGTGTGNSVDLGLHGWGGWIG